MFWYNIIYKKYANGHRFYNYTIANGKALPYDFITGDTVFTVDNITSGPISLILNSNAWVLYFTFPRLTAAHSIENSYNYIIGRPGIITSKEELTINKDTIIKSLPTTTISGSYKIPSVLLSQIPDSLTNGTIPLKYVVNGVIYNYFVFTGSNANQYIYEGSVFPDPYNFGGYIYPIKSGNPGRTYSDDDWTIFSRAGNGNIEKDFVGSKIDFGTKPQEVPTDFKTWVDNNFTFVYPYSFTVKTMNGDSILSSLMEAPSMIKGNLSVLGNRKTLVLTGSNGTDYTLEWDSITPENRTFTGLSFSPNSKVPNIPVGTEMYFNLEGDISLYECYSIYRPPITTFSVNFYKNKSESNRVDKTDYLTSEGTLNGVLREESSITKPVITFESLDIPVFNYVYIPIFNRYYFVNDITSIRYKLWQISLSVDPLMTYKDAIMQCVGFIDRNEHEFNAGIIDKKRAIEQGRTMEVESVTNELFTGVEGTFSLCGLNATAVNVES